MLSFIVQFVFASATAPIFGSLAQANEDDILIRRFHSLAAERPAYQLALSRGEVNLASATLLFEDSSPELAGGQLQNLIQTMVVQRGGEIESSNIDPYQVSNGLIILSVDLVITLQCDHLADLLSGIETAKPLLIARSIDIRSTDMGDQTGPLNIQLQINGYSDQQ